MNINNFRALINRASVFSLIYILFNYWITPLYLLLDKLFFDNKYTSKYSLYGNIEFIPFYLIILTILVFILFILTLTNKDKINRSSNLENLIIKPKFDSILAYSFLFISVFISLNSSSNFRYINSGIFEGLNLIRSLLTYFILSIWFFRNNYIFDRKRSFKWYTNTIFYALTTLISSNGLHSILIFFAWIHQLLFTKDNSGKNLKFKIQKYIYEKIYINKKVNLISLFFIIFFFFIPSLSLKTIYIGHANKVGSKAIDENTFSWNYYFSNYALKIGLNRPEFFTVYNSPKIDAETRKINSKKLIKNIKYRANKLMNIEQNYEKGEAPPRTNLMQIANYKTRSFEGTSPGLLSSVNYYLPPFLSIIFEIIYLGFSTILLSLFSERYQKRYILKDFLIVFFILRELLASPVSTMTILDNYIIVPSLIVILFILKPKLLKPIRFE